MARFQPLRRTQRPLPGGMRPGRPAAPPPFRTADADGPAESPGQGEAIGKVARFDDVPRAGRVRDVIFERTTGEVLAYEVDPGDGEAWFVPAGRLTRETPSTLHFASADRPLDAACDHEFMTLEHLPSEPAS